MAHALYAFPKVFLRLWDMYFVSLFPTSVLTESFRNSWSFGTFGDITYEVYRKQIKKKKKKGIPSFSLEIWDKRLSLTNVSESFLMQSIPS